MGKLAFDAEGASLQIWPDTMRSGDRIAIAFLAAVLRGAAARDAYEVTLHDHRRRRVATIARGPLRPTGGVVCIEWDGRSELGAEVRPGRYLLRVTRPASTFLLERTLYIEP